MTTEEAITQPVDEASGAEDASSEAQLELLRAADQVKPIDEDWDGTGIAHVPNGVYGFSNAPHAEAPLFRKGIFRSFEVHKSSEGSVLLVGFVTEAENRLLEDRQAAVQLSLYPSPWEASRKAVSIPLHRVSRAKGPSREKGNFLQLYVESKDPNEG